MPYDKNNVLVSERPYQVLRKLVEDLEEGSYATEIAQELESNQQNISEIINNFREAGLIQKGKRTKAQYYILDNDGLLDIFISFWEEEIEKDSLQYQVLIELLEEPIIEKSNLRSLLVLYVRAYCHHEESSTIKKMLVEDFLEDLDRTIRLSESEELELPDGVRDHIPTSEIPIWLKQLHAVLELVKLPSNLEWNLEKALRRYNEIKEEMEE